MCFYWHSEAALRDVLLMSRSNHLLLVAHLLLGTKNLKMNETKNQVLKVLRACHQGHGRFTAPAGKRMISVVEDPPLRVLAAAKIMLFPAVQCLIDLQRDLGIAVPPRVAGIFISKFDNQFDTCATRRKRQSTPT